jgi:LacI family transcriptional regulator
MQETGYQAVSQLLALDSRPTALFASNDSMAIGALHALHEAGLRVPDDMALAGFDDIPSAQYMNPPLSTVHVPIYELGARAAELLIHRTNGTSDVPQEGAVLSTELALRASCGCGTAE